jgi:signal transduction histidine kinase
MTKTSESTNGAASGSYDRRAVMDPQDSYKALAASIESSIRAELPPRRGIPDFTASADEVLIAESRAGERRIANLRVAVAVGTIGFCLWARYINDLTATWRVLSNLALVVSWGIAAVALAVALSRGWYRPALRDWVPAIDALVIGGMIFLLRDERTSTLASVHIVGVQVALCGFLAMSGALRLSKRSAKQSALLALGLFWFSAVAGNLSAFATFALGAELLALGILSVVVTDLVRRVASNEVKRLAFSELYQQAQQTADAREEVLRIVSHDLRNPLGTIGMSASLMLEIPLSDEERAKHLRTIKRAGERMNRMIQDLLDVARFEAGRLSVKPAAVDIAALLSEAEAMLRPLAAERSLALDVNVAVSSAAITADSGRILQLLSNLVGNAIKFTPPGGRISIRATDDAQNTVFAVSDTGPGIPADKQERVFNHFWQGDPHDRRGIGLGLAISKGIVEAHGGRIWVESVVGSGTTFFFTLPKAGAVPSI